MAANVSTWWENGGDQGRLAAMVAAGRGGGDIIAAPASCRGVVAAGRVGGVTVVKAWRGRLALNI